MKATQPPPIPGSCPYDTMLNKMPDHVLALWTGIGESQITDRRKQLEQFMSKEVKSHQQVGRPRTKPIPEPTSKKKEAMGRFANAIQQIAGSRILRDEWWLRLKAELQGIPSERLRGLCEVLEELVD